jgi:hypothetical protein
LPGTADDIDAEEGRDLFAMSSLLPIGMRSMVIEHRPTVDLHAEARAFAFNAGLDDLALMLDIGTRLSIDVELESELTPPGAG